MKLSEWMKRSGSVAVALVVGLVAADPRPAQAQATPATPTIEELQRKLDERDAIIADLLRRVEALERAAPATPTEVTPPPKQGREVAAPTPSAPRAKIGAIEVTEEKVERALERALVQVGALLLPVGTAQIGPNFSYVRQEVDTPVFLTQEGEQFLAADEVRRDSLEASLTLFAGLPFDSQLELDVPYQYSNESTVTRVRFAARLEEERDASGFGDVSVGLAKTLLREGDWWPDLIGRVQWDTNSGETEDGISLGTGFHEIRGSLTAVKRQDPLVFVGGVSYETTFERSGVDPGAEFGFSIGTVLAASPETSLRFFLNQTFINEVELDGREIPGTDQAIGTFTFGVSSILAARVLFDITAGIGLTEEAADYFVNVSLPIRFDLPFRF
jgi:hypothetical protein